MNTMSYRPQSGVPHGADGDPREQRQCRKAVLLGVIFALILAQVSNAQAQSDTDEEAAQTQWFGDAQLRYDHVSFNWPREDLDRGKLNFRPGVRWLLGENLELTLAARLAVGSDSNSDNAENLDNGKSDAATLDQWFLAYFTESGGAFRIGKHALPQAFTPMLWDADLRPVGVSFVQRTPVGDFDEMEFSVGAYKVDHYLDDDPVLVNAQLGYRWRPGAPLSMEVFASYWHFEELDGLSAAGARRTNSGFALMRDDFQLADIQFSLLGRSEGGYPWLWRTNVVENVSANQETQGVRTEFIAGDARSNPGQWEWGISYQRVQENAVVAAFNEDDWWFPTRMRGAMPWVSYGIMPGMWVRLAGFYERRDDQTSGRLERAILDFNWEY